MNSEREKLCATVLFIANDPVYVLVRRRVKETKPLNLSCETNTVCWPLYTNSSEARGRMLCATKLWRHSKWRRNVEPWNEKTGSAFACVHRKPRRLGSVLPSSNAITMTGTKFVSPRELAPPANPCVCQNPWALKSGSSPCYLRASVVHLSARFQTSQWKFDSLDQRD